MERNENLPARQQAPVSPPAGHPGYEDWPPGPPDYGPEEETLDWRRYIAAVLRYKWLIGGVTLLGAVAGVVAALSMTQTYRAEGRVWIEEQRREGRGIIETAQPLEDQGWVELMRTHAVLEGVVRERRLNVTAATPADSGIIPYLTIGESFEPGAYVLVVERSGREYRLVDQTGETVTAAAVGDSLGGPKGFALAAPRGALEPGSEYAFTLLPTGLVARDLAGTLNARVVRAGNFMVVRMQGITPEGTAATLQSILGHFVETAADLKRARLDELTNIMETQLAAASENLNLAEASLQNFRAATITLPSETGAPIAGGIAATQDPVIRSYNELQFTLEQVRRDRAAIARALAGTDQELGALEVIPAVQETRELGATLAQLADRRAERRALLQNYTPEHPQVQEVDEEIIALETRTVPAMAQSVMSRLDTQERTLEGLIGTASGRIRQIPARTMEEQRLARNRDVADRLYRQIQASYEEARLAAVSSVPDIRLIDPVAVPTEPVTDTRIRLFLMFLLGGVGTGFLVAFIRDRLDPRLHYPGQIRAMGLPILAAIPHIRSLGDLGSLENTAELVESFRNVRLTVSFENGNGGPVTLTITSPGSGDGKSFVAANLALAYAELGRRTLLIDGDTRRGALHRMFGLERKPGLLDLLDGQATLGEVIKATQYRALDLLPAGTRLSRGPELLSTDRLTDLLRELGGRYDTILVDSPPLGAGVDPLLLATATRNALIVLRTGTTDREMTESKLDDLQRFPVRILGAVVNDVAAGRLYGGYEIYGYLPGYEPRDEAASPAR